MNGHEKHEKSQKESKNIASKFDFAICFDSSCLFEFLVAIEMLCLQFPMSVD